MKSKLIIAGAVITLLSTSQVFAQEGMGHDGMMEEKGSMMEGMESAGSELPNVGNKICPISGEVIAKMGDGKGVQVEHEGKMYNLCCTMCAKDFQKDPQKYIQKINEELESAGGAAPEDTGGKHSGHSH